MSLKNDIIDSLLSPEDSSTAENVLDKYMWRYYAEGEEDKTIVEIQNALRKYYNSKRPVPKREFIENALGLFRRTRPLPSQPGEPAASAEHLRGTNSADALRYLMEKKPVSEGTVARETGIPQPVISNWISKNRSNTVDPFKLHKLLTFLWPPNKTLSSTDRQNVKRFVLMVNSALIRGGDGKPLEKLNKWLDKKIEHRDWPDISFPAFCPLWLSEQHAANPKKTNQKQAGLLLRACRHYREQQPDGDKITDSICQACGISPGTYRAWEGGTRSIDRTKLGPLIAVLSPFPEHIKQLSLLVVPELNTAAGAAWLDRRIKAGNWSTDAFLTTNNSFRNILSDNLQAGWLLRDLRNAANINADILAQRVGVSKNLIVGCERGEISIRKSILGRKLGPLITVLKPSASSIKSLTALVIPELNTPAGQRWLDKQITAARTDESKWEYWSRNVFTAADSSFLELFPKAKQGGRLLRDLSLAAGKEIKDLAAALEVHPDTVSLWQNGEAALILPKYKAKLTNALNLFDDTGERTRPESDHRFLYSDFATVINESNTAIENNNAKKKEEIEKQKEIRDRVSSIIEEGIEPFARLYRAEVGYPLEERIEVVIEIFSDYLHANPTFQHLIARHGTHCVVDAVVTLLEEKAFGSAIPEEYERDEVIEKVHAKLTRGKETDIVFTPGAATLVGKTAKEPRTISLLGKNGKQNRDGPG